MNNKLKQKLLKAIITISIIEGIYLFALPFAMNYIANTNFVKNIFEAKTNATIDYEQAKFKTHIKPALTISVAKLNVNDKDTGENFVSATNTFEGTSVVSKLVNLLSASTSKDGLPKLRVRRVLSVNKTLSAFKSSASKVYAFVLSR